MPRTARASVGGVCYYVLNRGNGREDVFHKDGDYAAFLDLMAEANDRLPMRILGYMLMERSAGPRAPRSGWVWNRRYVRAAVRGSRKSRMSPFLPRSLQNVMAIDDRDAGVCRGLNSQACRWDQQYRKQIQRVAATMVHECAQIYLRFTSFRSWWLGKTIRDDVEAEEREGR